MSRRQYPVFARAYPVLNIILSVVKIVLAVFMMIAGVVTAVMPLDTTTDDLGFIFNNRAPLVIFGAVFFLSGLTLFLGKIRGNREMTGHGLMAIYLCFVFSGILNAAASDWHPESWVGNAVAAAFVAVLWLWWKYKVRLQVHSELYARARRLGIRD